MSDGQELYVIDYPARQPEQVWSALERALVTMDPEAADDDALVQAG